MASIDNVDRYRADVLRPASIRQTFIRLALLIGGVALIGQAAVIAKARPQDLVTGPCGMADILRRSFPPDVQNLRPALGGAIETFDIALLGTCVAIVLSLPLAVLAAENVTPSRPLYLGARGVIAVTRAVPDPGVGAAVRDRRRIGPVSGSAGIGGALHRHARQAIRRNHRGY